MARGVLELDGVCVEQRAQSLCVSAASVGSVSDDGMTNMGKMNPDLVGAAGEGSATQ